MAVTASAFLDRLRRRRTFEPLRLYELTLPGPGTPQVLRFSDRARYLPAVLATQAWAGTGALPSPWATLPTVDDLTLVSGRVRAGTVAPAITCAAAYQGFDLPQDAWIEVTLATFPGWADAIDRSAGVLLRIGTPAGGAPRFAAARATYTGATGLLGVAVGQYLNGLWSELAGLTRIPWTAGDVLRLEAQGATVRVLRNGIRLLSATVSRALVGPGAGGLEILLGTGAAAGDVELGTVRLGELRREYLPLVLQHGSCTQALGLLDPRGGPPVASAVLSNQQPCGGAARLSDLWARGTARTGVYDLTRAELAVRLLPEGGTVGLDDVELIRARVQEWPALLEDRIESRTGGERLQIPDEGASLIVPCASSAAPAGPPAPARGPAETLETGETLGTTVTPAGATSLAHYIIATGNKLSYDAVPQLDVVNVNDLGTGPLVDVDVPSGLSLAKRRLDASTVRLERSEDPTVLYFRGRGTTRFDPSTLMAGRTLWNCYNGHAYGAPDPTPGVSACSMVIAALVDPIPGVDDQDPAAVAAALDALTCSDLLAAIGTTLYSTTDTQALGSPGADIPSLDVTGLAGIVLYFTADPDLPPDPGVIWVGSSQSSELVLNVIGTLVE